MTFNSSQAGMAFFLLICTLFNIWFLFVSGRRAFAASAKEQATLSLPNVKRSVFAMALFDIPWVWLCAIQCLYNTFTIQDEFHQSYGEDSLGCRFMGWYSSFSMVSMMGSNCLVAFYLLRNKNNNNIHNNNHTKLNDGSGSTSFWDTTAGLMVLSCVILVAACLFASMPLMQGDGYLLTSGGYCYADFTNETQSSIMLALVLLLLVMSTALWVQLGLGEYGTFYAIFFVTWVLWIPACAYGIKNAAEIASPYMLIGAIVGHANALINPLLYGWHLFVNKLDGENRYEVTMSQNDEEQALKYGA